MSREIFDMNKLKFIKYKEDQRFGKIMIYIDENNKKYMGIEISVNTDIELNLNLKLLKERLYFNCNKIIKLHDYKVQKISDKKHIILTIYDYFSSDILKIDFNDDLMKLLIFDMVEALNYLQLKNKINGNLKPEFIIYDEKIKKFILCDAIINNISPNQIQIKNIKSNNNIYLSPIIYFSIKNKLNKWKHNAFKSEIFSLGLIILEVGLLKNIQDIYYKDQIDNNKLNNLIKEFCSKFKNNLNEYIKNFLILNENNRPDPFKVFNMIMKKLDVSIYSDRFTHKSLASYPLNYSINDDNFDKILIKPLVGNKLIEDSQNIKKEDLNKDLFSQFDEKNKSSININNSINSIKINSHNLLINLKTQEIPKSSNSYYIFDNVNRVYIPMNYNDEEYKDKIVNNVNVIFEEKNSDSENKQNNNLSPNKPLFTSRNSNLTKRSILTSRVQILKDQSLENYNYSKYKYIKIIRNGEIAKDKQYYIVN